MISGVPLDLSEEEIKQSLAGQQVSYVKRFLYKSEKGVVQSPSVLLCLKSILPVVVDIGYLRFRTRVYTPPPRTGVGKLFWSRAAHCVLGSLSGRTLRTWGLWRAAFI